MRKIILTGAVLAMLTSAAPMVHAQIDQEVQEALKKKVDKDAGNIEISEWQTKLGDGKNEAGNTGLVTGGTLNKALEGEITKAKNDLKADIEEKAETQRQSSFLVKGLAESNQKLLVGADGNGGLNNDFKNLKNVVGENENEGLQKGVKENKEKIVTVETEQTQQKQKIDEVNRKVEAMTNGQNDVKKDIAELGGRINVTGAMSAALAGLKPLQYDPMAPTQVMGSVSTYEGQQAYALGLAHFTSEDLMVHGGVSFTNSHKYMANVGVTYKFGHSAEKSMIPMRYQAGPISSIYVMQKENEMMREKMAQQEERIAQLEEMIMNMKK